MADIERFLEPIPGSNPGGTDLRYAPVYDKIKEARRQEASGPMGLWEHETKTADFKLVIKLAEDALIKNSKDLQIAAWLTEAWIYRDAVQGLISGLQLLQGLVEKFWDNLYPEIDEGDAEMRATPLEWVGSYFDPSKGSSPVFAVRSVPLTKSGFGYFVYQESRKVGYEEELRGNDVRLKARKQAIAEGKIAPEDFDKEFEATPKAFYKKLEADCKLALEQVEAVNELFREKFADVAPSYSPMRKALEEVGNAVHILLLKKLEKEPDPVEAAPVAAETSAADGEGGAVAQANGAVQMIPVTMAAALDFSKLGGGEIADPEQAALHVAAAAQFLRQKMPSSPVSYLLLRALRWGEIRGAGENYEKDLPAPGSDIRVVLRTSASASNWKKVLETAEMAMSGASGRGWLDIQRYTIRACDELGYANAAKALRSELRALLTDFPTLPSATLSDDTGTANPDTLNWLRQEGLIT